MLLLFGKFLELVLEVVYFLEMLCVALVLYSTQQPLELFGLPIKFILPFYLFNSPSTIGAIRLHYDLLDLAVLLVDLLQINFHPGTVQKPPELLLIYDSVLNNLQAFRKVI